MFLLQANSSFGAELYTPARRLRTNEIPQIVNDFRLATRNAIKAGKSYYILSTKTI